MILTFDQFESISDLIYRCTGLRYETKKMYFLSKRIEKRMDALGMAETSEYLRQLRRADSNGEELQCLIDLLTVNETYFFRDFPQMIAFAEHCLQDVVKAKITRKDKKIKIWSAGCSTGEEPYTLAIILSEMLDDLDSWQIEIIATDIDRNVIQKARAAIFSKSSIRDVPKEYLKRYFQRDYNSNYLLSDRIKRMVQFENANLMDKGVLRMNRDFDFIFCRNVLIYFDNMSRKQVVDHFYMALNPSGYIFLGSSESVSQINAAFKMKRAGDHLVYFKE